MPTHRQARLEAGLSQLRLRHQSLQPNTLSPCRFLAFLICWRSPSQLRLRLRAELPPHALHCPQARRQSRRRRSPLPGPTSAMGRSQAACYGRSRRPRTACTSSPGRALRPMRLPLQRRRPPQSGGRLRGRLSHSALRQRLAALHVLHVAVGPAAAAVEPKASQLSLTSPMRQGSSLAEARLRQSAGAWRCRQGRRCGR